MPTPRTSLFLLLISLAACGSDDADESGTDKDSQGDSATDTDTTTDTGAAGPLSVSDLSATVGSTVGSIVVVTWTQDRAADTHLEFSFDDGVWLASPTVARPGGTHTDLILGAPYGSEITWRLVVTAGTQTYTAPDAVTANGALPPGLPASTVYLNETARRDLDAGPYWFIGLGVRGWYTDPWWQIIVDSQDRVVWAYKTPKDRTSMHARVARDQRSLFLDRNSFWVLYDLGAESTVDQVYIDGSLIRTFVTPGLHHPFTDLPDGSLAYGSQHTTETELLRIAHQDGTMEEVWDCNEWFESVSLDGYSCASNTLTYDEATNKFLFSFYSLNSIIEVDRSTGAVDRWFGDLPGSYTFDPPESAFWWQHGGIITESGTLLTSSDNYGSTTETVLREYSLDDDSRTLTEVWNFGLGEGIYGVKMGEGVRLPNGNTVHNYGAYARLREVTVEGEVIHDVEWSAGAIGRSMPIADLYTLAPPAPE